MRSISKRAVCVRAALAFGALLGLAGGAASAAESCPGNPDALGTSRVVTVDPATSPFLGALQYKQTVPLKRGEVILTFDDGPLPPMTNRVLDTLAHECVKATFFIVGRMAGAYPKVLQRTAEAGHTIGTHSQTHPLIFPKLKQQAGLNEIEQGFASTNAALAPVGLHTVPFFRFPGLGRTKFYEQYTQEHGISVFSVDLVADDWMHLKPEEVMKRALDRLEARGSGILLLHDIQPSTAVMLPTLLRELKRRNFQVVHVEYSKNGAPGVSTLPASSAGLTPTPAAVAPVQSAVAPATAPAGVASAPAAAPAMAPAAAAPARTASVPLPPKRPAPPSEAFTFTPYSNGTTGSTGGAAITPTAVAAQPAPAAEAAQPAAATSLWPRILTDIFGQR